jgi:hypothetical protein
VTYRSGGDGKRKEDTGGERETSVLLEGSREAVRKSTDEDVRRFSARNAWEAINPYIA